MRPDDDDLVLDDGEAEDEEYEPLPPSFAVLLRRRQEWSFQEVAEVLRDHAGLSVADAASLSKKRPGILCTGLEQEIARDLVRALRGHEIDCFLVSESELYEPFVPVRIEALELLDEGFRAVVSSAIGTTVSFPWLDVAFLAAGHITSASPGGDIYAAVKRGKTGVMAPRPGVLAFAPQVKKKDLHVLDIHLGFTHRDRGATLGGTVLQVSAGDFNFGCLEDEHTIHPVDNLVRLTRRLATLAPQAALNPGAASCLRGDSRELQNFVHLQDFHAENLWLLCLQELEKRKKEREGAK